MRNSHLTRCRRSLHLLYVLAAVLSMAVLPLAGLGQTASAQSPRQQLLDQLRQLQEQRSAPQTPTISLVDQSREALEQRLEEEARRRQEERLFESLREAAIPPKLSPLEEDFSQRFLGEDFSERFREPLRQFGYEAFLPGLPGAAPPAPMIGAIQDSFVLGIGDELIVTFHGQTSLNVLVRVDREGRVILPDLPPVAAAGRTYGAFVRELEAITAAALLGTEVFVSLGAVRTVSVLVIGEVERPGVQQLTGLSTLIDALIGAGGIKKTGTLRRIQIARGGTTFWVDAYDLLFMGDFGRDTRVVDGDRIVVHPIGPTVAVAGKVKRPGIFELAEGQRSIALGELLKFGGGPLRPRGNRILQYSADASGREHVVERDAVDLAAALEGDILVVAFKENVVVGSVTLDGHVRLKQRRSVASASSVRKLIPDVTLLRENPYMPFAAVLTTDPKTYGTTFVPINLQHVLDGRVDHRLRSGDTVIVLGRDDVRYLASSDVQAVLLGRPLAAREPDRPAGQAGTATITGLEEVVRGQLDVTAPAQVVETALECDGLRALSAITASARAGRFANAIRGVVAGRELAVENRLPCPDIFDRYGDLLPFLLDYVTALDGEVRVPGAYPILPGAGLESIVAVAGGLTREVDLRSVEITRFAFQTAQGTAPVQRGFLDLTSSGLGVVTLNPGDSVRFNAVFSDRESGPVLLSGEFVRPGLYQIRRGERLSEVIARSGGLTPQAYAFGAVFTRERVKDAEREAFKRSAQELELALVAALTRPGRRTSQAGAAAPAIRELAQSIRDAEPVGRVVIEADPTVLDVRPEFDTVLEPGDRLFVPKRPNSVSVIGEVLNPGSMQFVPAMKVDGYIDRAGGYRQSADESRVFVVLPNGTAQTVSVSPWNYTPLQIPPGSTVVIPRDPAPFDLLALLQDTTQILSQLAISAASIAVISRDN